MTVHVYNNYFDGNAKYGVGVTTGSSCFVEQNFFRNAHDPMMSSKQGTDAQGAGTFSGEKGGVIKAYNNKFVQNNSYGVKFQYITNKYDYTNNKELGEYKEWTETVGTDNGNGTWTIYDSEITTSSNTIATNSLIAVEDATIKGAYYQGSKGKTMFYLDVPANTTKVIIKAKTGSSTSGATTTLTVNGVKSGSIGNSAYEEFEFAVSGLTADSTLEVVNSGSNSLNISEIKVIATSGWETKLTSGADLTNIDAYEVDNRSDTVPDTVKTKSGGTTYSNFDTEKGDSGLGLANVPSDPDKAKAEVLKYSGRYASDLYWNFTNSIDDASYAKNDELNSALVAYKTSMTKIQGEASSSGSGSEGGDEPSTGGDTPVTPETPTVTGVTIVGFTGKDTSSDSSLVSGTWNMKSGSSVTYEGTAYNCAKIESGTAFNVNVPVGTKVTLVTKTTPNKLSVEGTNITAGFEDKSTYFTYTYTTSTNPSVIKKGSGSDANLACIVIEPAE